MDRSYDTLEVIQHNEHILIVKLNRPDAMNALNTRMGEELLNLWRAIFWAKPGPRCVILTGAGERAFCAGGDLKERKGMTDEAWRTQHEIFEQAHFALIDCPVPVIGVANGVAYGGGLETLLACDFIYASSKATFALSETKLGIMPGGGGTQNLPRAIGERRAKEMIFSARPVSAAQGEAWGFINRVFEPDQLMAGALDLAQAIADNGPIAVRAAKKSVHHGLQMAVADAYQFEIATYDKLIGTSDRHEGVLAFNEKRKPIFTGK